MIPDSQSNEKEIFEAKLGDIVKIFSAVSSEDAMKIFYAAKDGIKSSTKIIKELGLTQKRYYTRLKELMEAGLIYKEDESYKYTTLGKICYKLGQIFMETLSHDEQLTLIDGILKSRVTNMTEKDRIIKMIMDSNMTDFLTLFASEEITGIKKLLKTVETYDDLVKTVSNCFEKAQRKIRLAGRYTTPELAEKSVELADKGLTMEWIDGDQKNLSTKLQILKFIFTNPNMLKSFFDLMKNPNVDIRFCSEVPYSFMSIDDRYGAIEIIHPVTKKFLFAIFFEDYDLCKKINKVFDDLKEKSIEHPYKQLAVKIAKLKA